MATLIAEEVPENGDKIYNLVGFFLIKFLGSFIAKAKKSSVLKATEICNKLYASLKNEELLFKCEIIREKENVED